MDTLIKVDENLCIGCGSCVRTCPASLIRKEDFPVAIEGAWDHCIDCGHCVSVCPTGALHQRSMGPEDCEEIDIHLIPRWDRVQQFLTARRSVRRYSPKPIAREKIEKLLNVTRFAPNGQNRQILRWLVVDDPAEVRQVAGMVIDWMKSMKEANPALFEDAMMQAFIDGWEAGGDTITRNASSFVTVYAEANERTAPEAATIAIAYLQLAATGLGLGTCFSNSINYAAVSHPSLIEKFGLPEGCKPYATCLLGHPAETFHRIPTRKPLSVNWLSDG